MGWVLNLKRERVSPYSTRYCHVTSLSLKFLITNMGIIALTLQGLGEES